MLHTIATRILSRPFHWLLIGWILVGNAGCGGGGNGGHVAPPPPTKRSYASPQTYTVGVPISPLDPTVTGAPTGYQVTPDLMQQSGRWRPSTVGRYESMSDHGVGVGQQPAKTGHLTCGDTFHKAV